MSLDIWYLLFVITQLIHSQEEIHTGFYKKSQIFGMSKKLFITFEIVFSLFILLFVFFKEIPFNTIWKHVFILLMFANGIEHFLWFLKEKKYVPGVVTAFIALIMFIFYYFSHVAI
jgi:hypothetical protein